MYSMWQCACIKQIIYIHIHIHIHIYIFIYLCIYLFIYLCLYLFIYHIVIRWDVFRDHQYVFGGHLVLSKTMWRLPWFIGKVGGEKKRFQLTPKSFKMVKMFPNMVQTSLKLALYWTMLQNGWTRWNSGSELVQLEDKVQTPPPRV